jgi:hypothetical protein
MRKNKVARFVAAVACAAILVVPFAAAQVGGPVLSGQVANWDGGEARLAAESFTEDTPLGAIAETTIDEDGSFELVLPAEVPAELLTPLDAAEICPEAPEGLSLEPESFMGAGVFGLLVYEDESPVGFVMSASSEAVALEQGMQVGNYAVFYAYATEPVTIRGSCVREGETEAIDIDLQRGWNTLVSSVTEVTDGAPSAFETTVGEAPGGAGWFFAAMPEMPEGEGEAPEVIWTASNEGEGLPEEGAPGYTVFTLENDGEGGRNLTLFRLKEGASLEAFQEAVRVVDQTFAEEGGDAPSAINAVLELADVLGETFAEPGGSGSFGVVLEEGEYLVESTPDSEEGLPEHVYQTLSVSGEPQAEAPQADQTVQMVDFAFALPPDIQAGKQTWQVVNSGQQLHHMFLFRLQDGKTMDDFMAWMETEGEGEPAADEAGGVGIMSSGQSNYVDLELSPGEYVAICFMPDHLGEATGQPHFMLGMMQSFTVAGE